MNKLAQIKETIESVKKTLQENSGFLGEYQEMAKKWEEDRKRYGMEHAAKIAEQALAAAPDEGGDKKQKAKKGKKKK